MRLRSISGAFLLTAVLTAAASPFPSPGQAGRGDVQARENPAEAKQTARPVNRDFARKAFDEGRKAEDAGAWLEASEWYAEAVTADPQNGEYALRRARARFQAGQQLRNIAEREAAAGRPEAARVALETALALDPQSSITRERLAQMRPRTVRELEPRPGFENRPVVLHPLAEKATFDYRGTTAGAWEELGKLFGITVTVDQELASRNVRTRLLETDFFTAAAILGQQTDTFFRALSNRMIFVTNDTPEKRKQYEPRVSRTLLLPDSATSDRMTEIRQAVREIAGVLNPQLDTRTRQLVLEGTPAALDVAVRLVNELEQPRSEVMLEIVMLEIDRTAARRLGITTPSQARIFTLTPSDIREAQSSAEGLLRVITRIFGTQATAGGVATGNFQSILPPLLAFGGGKTVFLATLPGAAADFSDALSIVRSARRVLMRAEDGSPATFFVGDRYPISLGTLSPSIGGQVITGDIRRITLATGVAPIALATGDLDATAGNDIVVANSGETSISVFLNSGDGTFRAGPSIATTEAPRAVLLRDFSNDSQLDLAVAETTANTVSVLLGNGDGSFTAGVTLSTGESPVALAAGDINSDNRPDLIVVNQGDNSISFFLNTGGGTFTTGGGVPVGATPVAIVAGDWNGDARLDLAVVNSASNTVSILLGDGAGGFTPAADLATGSNPVAIAAGNLNQDNNTDLVVANGDDGTISIFLGNGDGTFAKQPDVRTAPQPTDIALGDFTGDGRLDIIVANSSLRVLTVLVGNGDGTILAAVDLPTDAAAFALSAADMNGDGRLDLVTANRDADSATVLINASTSTSAVSTTQSGLTAFPGALYEDLGVKVKATPKIHSDGNITIELGVELRALGAQSFNGIPVITNRTIEQTVRVRDGVTSLLSGFLQSDHSLSIRGTPNLALIPGAGGLAGRRDRSRRETEIVLAVTPHLVRLAPRNDSSIYAGRKDPAAGGAPAGTPAPSAPPRPE